MPTKNKIKVLFIRTDWAENEYRMENDAYGGIGYYRLVKPASALNRDEFEVDVVGKEFSDNVDFSSIPKLSRYLRKYNIVITKPIDNPIAASNLLASCKKNNVKLVIDLDDNIFALRKDQPNYLHYMQGGAKKIVASTLLSLCDGIFCSTRPLKEVVTDFLKRIQGEQPVCVLPNLNDSKDWAKFVNNKPVDKFVIGWHGSMSHDSDFKVVLPALEELMLKHDDIYVEMTGLVRKESAARLFKDVDPKVLSRFILSPGTPSWDGFAKLLMEKNWNVGIAPLIDDDFNRSKSHIKWMEYAMMGIPCVASDVPAYNYSITGKLACIKHENTGFLVKDDKWFSTLEKLYNDVKLRQRIGSNARSYVVDKLQYKSLGYLWERSIKKVLGVEN